MPHVISETKYYFQDNSFFFLTFNYFLKFVPNIILDKADNSFST